MRTLALTGAMAAAVLAAWPVAPMVLAGEDPSPPPAGEGPAEKDPEAERARKLVEQLGDQSWEKREAATKELATMGAAALPHVEAALKSADPEVAVRAAGIVAGVRSNAQREISERCLIKDLFFCGPFTFKKEEANPLELVFPPEKELELGAAYGEGEASARWSRPFKAGARGAVDFDAVFGHHEYAVAYALASVKAGKAKRKLLLLLGSDDSVRVWLNGTAVHTNPAKRGVAADQDAVEIELQPGWNDILVKVAQFAGAWGVCLRLTEPDRSEAKGLTWDPTRGGQRRIPVPAPAPTEKETEAAPAG